MSSEKCLVIGEMSCHRVLLRGNAEAGCQCLVVSAATLLTGRGYLLTQGGGYPSWSEGYRDLEGFILIYIRPV